MVRTITGSGTFTFMAQMVAFGSCAGVAAKVGDLGYAFLAGLFLGFAALVFFVEVLTDA